MLMLNSPKKQRTTTMKHLNLIQKHLSIDLVDFLYGLRHPENNHPLTWPDIFKELYIQNTDNIYCSETEQYLNWPEILYHLYMEYIYPIHGKSEPLVFQDSIALPSLHYIGDIICYGELDVPEVHLPPDATIQSYPELAHYQNDPDGLTVSSRKENVNHNLRWWFPRLYEPLQDYLTYFPYVENPEPLDSEDPYLMDLNHPLVKDYYKSAKHHLNHIPKPSHSTQLSLTYKQAQNGFFYPFITLIRPLDHPLPDVWMTFIPVHHPIRHTILEYQAFWDRAELETIRPQNPKRETLCLPMVLIRTHYIPKGGNFLDNGVWTMLVQVPESLFSFPVKTRPAMTPGYVMIPFETLVAYLLSSLDTPEL